MRMGREGDFLAQALLPGGTVEHGKASLIIPALSWNVIRLKKTK